MPLSLNLFRAPCEFVAGATTIEAIPELTHPEIAFIGRSNVGKSSLVNALIGQKSMARISQNPGATRQLNFFLLGDELLFVDMPGYGFAKVSKREKSDWDQLIRKYLLGRINLKRALVLIDSRRGLMQVDHDFLEKLDDSAVSYQIVLTKADTLSAGELARVHEATIEGMKKHAAAHPVILITSSQTRRGIEELQEQILNLIVGA